MEEPNFRDRRPHAALNLHSRRLKAMKIERLLDLALKAQPLKMLEIGTGSGGIAHYFAKHPMLQCEVVAVDVVDQRLLKCGYEFKMVENSKLPFNDGYFEVVITNHVIEHVGDRNEQRNHLSELRRVMNEKGVGYLAVPNRWMLVEPHYHLAFLSWLPHRLRSSYLRATGRGTYYDCEPLSLNKIERLLDETGFRYENLCTRALRETIELEGRQGLAETLISKISDRVFERLLPLMPTLIYRIERIS
ncbi:MAG: class I SAM-dependent methyltransferase [Desulfobacteraceae bacterium]|nr:MAG: class I SAM-dependent methyltransferase [Desulfobacteraceae bacterium]